VIGAVEGPDLDADIPLVSAFEEKALLGESLLVQGPLCGHSRVGCGHDTQVCPLPGKERAADGAATVDRLGIIVAAQLKGPAPYGGTFQSRTLRVRIFYAACFGIIIARLPDYFDLPPGFPCAVEQ
jgi:hypothetical protein